MRHWRIKRTHGWQPNPEFGIVWGWNFQIVYNGSIVEMVNMG